MKINFDIVYRRIWGVNLEYYLDSLIIYCADGFTLQYYRSVNQAIYKTDLKTGAFKAVDARYED